MTVAKASRAVRSRRQRVRLAGTAYLALVAVLLAVPACDRRPIEEGAGFAEPLTTTAGEREAAIAAHAAVPMAGAPAGAWVAGRKGELADCSECHAAGVDPGAAHTAPDQRAAHWEIDLDHAAGMTCRTCHDPEVPTRLAVLDGATAPVGVDHAYRLCGTCHQGELDDWRGGAHGKRLTGWAGPRIVQNCAGCHDPHDPALAPRYPVAQPTIAPERAPAGPNHSHAPGHGDAGSAEKGVPTHP